MSTTLTEVPAQNCQICRRKPSQLNDINSAKVEGDPTSAGFVISVLHTNIRAFECMIHIACRLDIEKWRVS